MGDSGELGDKAVVAVNDMHEMPRGRFIVFHSFQVWQTVQTIAVQRWSYDLISLHTPNNKDLSLIMKIAVKTQNFQEGFP